MKSVDSRPAFEHPRLTVPTTLSDLPTIPNKVDLDRTLPMEPVVLAQLCAQTQISERRRVLPRALEYSMHVLPGVELSTPPVALAPPIVAPQQSLAAQQAAVQRRQTILLILGPFLGLSLGMSLAWKLDLGRPRAARPELASPTASRGTGAALSAAAAKSDAPRPSATTGASTAPLQAAAPPAPGSTAPPVNPPTTMMPTWSASLPLNGSAAPGGAGNIAPLKGSAAPGEAGNTTPSNGSVAPGGSGNIAPWNGSAAPGGAGNTTPSNGSVAPGGAGNIAPSNGSAALERAGNTAPLNGSAAPGGAGNIVPPLNPASGGSAGNAAALAAPAVAPPSQAAAGQLTTGNGSSGAAPKTASLDWEPLLVFAPTRTLTRPGKQPLPSGRKAPPRGAYLGATPALTATADEEREAQLPAELPAIELPRSEPPPPKPPASSRPSITLDHALKPTPLTGNQQPVLPTMVRQMYRHESVVGTYRVCIQPSGTVSSVTAVTGIPFDDEIRRTLHSWRFAPRATPTCMEEELHFEVE